MPILSVGGECDLIFAPRSHEGSPIANYGFDVTPSAARERIDHRTRRLTAGARRAGERISGAEREGVRLLVRKRYVPWNEADDRGGLDHLHPFGLRASAAWRENRVDRFVESNMQNRNQGVQCRWEQRVRLSVQLMVRYRWSALSPRTVSRQRHYS